ncbi:hypothetical protein T492DRAFT_980627 [Pavlovales sp. CCMP2436]|nr:hypothetical protein T492DRAFT_980627 [Pavlovales sp. CCMP2436]
MVQVDEPANVDNLKVGDNVYARKVTTRAKHLVLDGMHLKQRRVSNIKKVGSEVVSIETKAKSATARTIIYTKAVTVLTQSDDDGSVLAPMDGLVLELEGKYFSIDGNELLGQQLTDAGLATVTGPTLTVPTISMLPIATNVLGLELPAHLGGGRPTTNTREAFYVGAAAGAYVKQGEMLQFTKESLETKERTDEYKARTEASKAKTLELEAQLNLDRFKASQRHY